MMLLIFFGFIFLCFSMIANLAWYSFNATVYDTPEIFDELLDVCKDIKISRILNPFVIFLAVFAVCMRNLPQLVLHLFFWWIIIPKRIMSK